MVRGKHKAVTFDTMVKFFIHQYDIPTKKDIEKLYTRLDRMEKLIRNVQASNGRRGPGKTNAPEAKKENNTLTASNAVYDIIKRSRKGLKISDIKHKTGFEDKKLRNILFRLHKLERIKRLSRGIYISA